MAEAYGKGSARIVSQIHDEIVVETPDIFELFEDLFGPILRSDPGTAPGQ